MLVPVDKIIEFKCPQTKGKWINTSIWYHPTIIEEGKEILEESVVNFADFDELLHNQIIKIETGKTIFGKDYVKLKCGLESIKLTRRNFKGCSFRVRYEKHLEWTFDFLMEELPSQDFIGYCINHDFHAQVFEK